MSRLSCSACGEETYVPVFSLVVCKSCGNDPDWSDFMLEPGEDLFWDEDGYLAVGPSHADSSY